MNIAAAYANLSAIQLKQMLGAAHADHRRQMEETKTKWAAEVATLRQTMSQNSVRWMFEMQLQKNENAALRRELDAVHEELLRANTVITEQGRKLAAHTAVVELEQKLHAARRLAS